MKVGRRLARIAIVALVIIGGAGLFYIIRHQPPPAPSFTVATVERGDIIQSVDTIGQLAPRVSVEVSSQISGLLTEVSVDFNTPVKKGQVLARIDPSTYEQALSQAQANFAAAEAADTLASLNAKRLRELRAQDLVTQQEYDAAEAQRQQSRASLLTSKAALQNARVNLDRCTIYSPIDGITIFKQAEVGKTVVSSFSAPTLFVIAQDLSQMRIFARITEVDVHELRPGQEVAFTVDALPGKHFGGRLIQIRTPYIPSDRQQAQWQNTMPTFEAVIDVDNPNLTLRPGLTANVSIIVEKRERVLRVPNGALHIEWPEGMASPPASPRNDSDAGVPTTIVYHLPSGDRDAAPQATWAQLGASDSVVTEVLKGLEEGDTVVTGFTILPKPKKRFLLL